MPSEIDKIRAAIWKKRKAHMEKLGMAENVNPAPAEPNEDLSELTLAQLREEAVRRGLPKSGSKADLVARLSEEG